jgi:hypothetical protein
MTVAIGNIRWSLEELTGKDELTIPNTIIANVRITISASLHPLTQFSTEYSL